MRLIRLVTVAFTLAVALAAEAQPGESAGSRTRDDDLVGIWVFDTTFSRGLKGTLTISRKGGAWRATLSGPRFPGGSSQPFATPLVLEPAGRDVWRGAVRSLADSMTLYLRIFRSAEGALLAAFRNPDQHSHGGAMQYRVEREGSTVRFSAPTGASPPSVRHEGVLVRDGRFAELP